MATLSTCLSMEMSFVSVNATDDQFETKRSLVKYYLPPKSFYMKELFPPGKTTFSPSFAARTAPRRLTNYHGG